MGFYLPPFKNMMGGRRNGKSEATNEQYWQGVAHGGKQGERGKDEELDQGRCEGQGKASICDPWLPAGNTLKTKMEAACVGKSLFIKGYSRHRCTSHCKNTHIEVHITPSRNPYYPDSSSAKIKITGQETRFTRPYYSSRDCSKRKTVRHECHVSSTISTS